MSRITAVMAARNAAATIEHSIASVIRQTWTDLELIVVDDASTDETPSILRHIDAPQLRVITLGAQRGPAAARNRAIAAARGDYIACIDADDVWMDDKIELQLKAFQDKPEARVAYVWADIVDADLRPAYHDQRVTDDGDIYERLLRGNFIVSGSNSMISKRALERVGGFDESLRAVEDWELHVRLASSYQFVNVPKVLVHYRLATASLSSNLELMEASFRHASTRVFGEAPERYRHLEAKSAAAFYLYLASRATQSGRNPRSWRAALRYVVRSIRLQPRNWVEVLRVASPFGSLRLSLRELLRRR